MSRVISPSVANYSSRVQGCFARYKLFGKLQPIGRSYYYYYSFIFFNAHTRITDTSHCSFSSTKFIIRNDKGVKSCIAVIFCIAVAIVNELRGNFYSIH